MGHSVYCRDLVRLKAECHGQGRTSADENSPLLHMQLGSTDGSVKARTNRPLAQLHNRLANALLHNCLQSIAPTRLRFSLLSETPEYMFCTPGPGCPLQLSSSLTKLPHILQGGRGP